MRYNFTLLDKAGKIMEVASNESNLVDALTDLAKVMYHYNFSISNLKPFYYFINKLNRMSRRKISVDRLTFIQNQITLLQSSLGD